MPTDCPDLEDIAALLDGKLTAVERARVTEHLASCESCYEVFAGTAHLLEDSRDEQLAPSAAPLRPFERPRETRPPRMRLWWAAAALAAMLAVTAGLFVLWQGARGAGPSTEQLASLVGGPIAADEIPWGRRMRGGAEQPTDLVAGREAFRLGVRLLDLRVALGVGDGSGAEETIGRLLLLFDRMILPPRSKTVDNYKEMRGKLLKGIAPRSFVARADAAEKTLDELQEDPRMVELGRWTEACRLAGASGLPDLFRERGTLRVLDRALEPPGKDEDTLDSAAVPEIQAIRNEIATGRFNPTDLGESCKTVLKVLDYD